VLTPELTPDLIHFIKWPIETSVFWLVPTITVHHETKWQL